MPRKPRRFDPFRTWTRATLRQAFRDHITETADSVAKLKDQRERLINRLMDLWNETEGTTPFQEWAHLTVEEYKTWVQQS